MRIIITTLIILITQIKFFYGQRSFDGDLLLLEQKIFYCKSDIDRNLYHLQKFDLYISEKDYSIDGLKEAKQINYELINDSINRSNFLWNAAIISQLNDDKTSASYYYKKYKLISQDTSIRTYLLAVEIYNGFDSTEVSNTVLKLAAYDKKFNSLMCMNRIYDYEIKHKIWYPIASAIVPGLGSAINGNIGKGATSFTLNAVSAYAIFLLVQNNLYLNAVLWGTAIGLKFYTGNIKLTVKLVEEKESLKKNTLANNCKCVLNKLLNEYPLGFK